MQSKNLNPYRSGNFGSIVMKKKFVCSHQYMEVFVGATESFELTKDIVLQNEVNTILMPYPFRIEHNGSQNVYKIKPTKSLIELLQETQKVMKREYDNGKCDAPHELSDFVIECVTVHENKCATIEVGS